MNDKESRTPSGGESSGAGASAADAERVGREAADRVTGKATEKAKGVTDRVREGTRDRVRRGQRAAAERIDGVARAIDRASEEFREQNLDFVAEGGERIASGVHRAQRYLEEQDPEDMLDDTRRFARRNPAVFLGGMFLAGLALSRFLTADTSRREESGHDARF